MQNKNNLWKRLTSLFALFSITFCPSETSAQPPFKFAFYNSPDLSQYETNDDLENAIPDIIGNASLTMLTPDGRCQTVYLPNNNQMVNAIVNANRQAQQRFEELEASGMSQKEAEEQVISEIHQGKFGGEVHGNFTVTDGCNIV